jgi:hypothetical protein
VIHALAALDIDVLVLTEFVDGDHHARFQESLKDIGFDSLAVSVKAPRQNQVLIAARTALAEHGGLPLPGHTEAATTNWLHRRLPDLKLEVVGFHAPMYFDADDRLGYWRQVEDIARAARNRPVIFVGDFRCDRHVQTRLGDGVIPRLTADGCTLAQPKGDWSYHAGEDALSDHALLSIRLQRPTATQRAALTASASVGGRHGRSGSPHLSQSH